MDSKRWKPSTEHAPGQGPVTDADAEKEIARLSIPRTCGEDRDEQFILRLLRDRARYQERIRELGAGLAEVLDDTAGGKALEYDEPQIICGLRQSVEQRNRALLGEVPDAT